MLHGVPEQFIAHPIESGVPLETAKPRRGRSARRLELLARPRRHEVNGDGFRQIPEQARVRRSIRGSRLRWTSTRHDQEEAREGARASLDRLVILAAGARG